MLFYDSPEYLTVFRRKLAHDLDRCESTKESIYYRNQILDNFDKKFIKSGPGVDTEMECYLKFLSVNAEMKALNDRYTSHLTNWNDQPILRRAKYICASILGKAPLLEEIFSLSKHSGGASVGVKFIDTSIEAKMTFPVSGSRAACRLWEHYKHWDWDYYSQACNLNEASGVFPETVTTAESRAVTVPKTNKIDRFIAVEPTLNMFFQQGISLFMNQRLEAVGLSLSGDQEKHRRLAYLGSITSRYGTIDFSSMSDRLSLAVCHFLLPKDWYSLLFTVRSHRTLLKGQSLPLHMISTMGNATTFPLETLILYCLATSACSQVKGYSPLDIRLHDVHVFGDDCILPSEACEPFISGCELVGFKINEDKSFISGSFRESCGGDFYHGRDVRPFYLKSLSSDVRRRQDKEAYLYTTINGVIRMYKKYFGTLGYVYDKQLLSYLFKLLQTHTNFVKFVPEDFPEDSGVTSLRELRRFLHAYPISLSQVGLNEHGQLLFSYLSYQFPHRKLLHEGLRYRSAQKWWSESSTDEMKDLTVAVRLKRKGGFYVKRVGRTYAVLPSALFGAGDPRVYLPSCSSERRDRFTSLRLLN